MVKKKGGNGSTSGSSVNGIASAKEPKAQNGIVTNGSSTSSSAGTPHSSSIQNGHSSQAAAIQQQRQENGYATSTMSSGTNANNRAASQSKKAKQPAVVAAAPRPSASPAPSASTADELATNSSQSSGSTPSTTASRQQQQLMMMESSSNTTCSDTERTMEHAQRERDRISRRDHQCQVDLAASGDEDLVEQFARLCDWRKMETICELAALLTPNEKLILDSVLRGSLAPQRSICESFERRVNNPKGLEIAASREPLEKQREMYLPSLALITPCNRASAQVLLRQLRKFIEHVPPVEIGRNEDVVQASIEQLLSFAVASLHHPAFSIDHQIELDKICDDLKVRLHELTPLTQGRSNDSCAPVIKTLKCIDFNDELLDAILEITWSDRLVTYAARNYDQLYDMQRRLLEAFGMEKHQNQRRVLPYFPRPANMLTMTSYIDQLSNLPARFLFDEKFADEFKDTRIMSSAIASSPPRHSALCRRGRDDTMFSPYLRNLSDLGVLPEVEVPPVPPPPPAAHATCPYCAGHHEFAACPDITIDPSVVAVPTKAGPDWDRIRCNCCPR